MVSEVGDWATRSDWSVTSRPGVHLQPSPSDVGEHLRGFTSTAQVPAVPGGWGAAAYGGDPSYLPTGTVPAVYGQGYYEPASLALRVVVWTTAVLLVVALAALAVHKVRPRWLSAITASSAAGAPGTPVTTTAPSHRPSSAQARHGSVVVTPSGSSGATVKVGSARYVVQIATTSRCWISVSVPGTSTPVFEAVVPAGTTKQFPAGKAGLTINIGASGTTVSALASNKPIGNWQYKPTVAPFTLTFVSG
ncbi:MAG: RodZ domain-containing protein [Acidimicrobiales bacterium]